MSPEIEKMKNFISILNKATKAYDEGHPLMSDKTWDDLYFWLQSLEKETGIVYPNSPTQTINYEVVNSLNKVTHNHPMLSLDKTKDLSEVEKFVKGHDWCAMFKMDGLTCSLTYEKGKLISAETRGNGLVGEDILHNVSVMKSVPKEIPVKDEKIVIDGEIICQYKDFEQFKEEYKNPRNFAAGSIRLLDSKIAATRKLTFVAWDLVEGYNDIDFFFWRLEKLDDWGFITVPRVGDAETVKDAMNILDDMRDGRDAYQNDDYQYYPIDGYVFKFESVAYGKSLGATDHHKKDAIAFKFYDEEYETKLKYITYDVSRNGILTPVAVFNPIEIEGSIVERASLHNMSIMKDILGATPYAGEKVWVIKSNQIIPQIARAEKKDYGDIVAAGGVTVGLGGDYGIVCPICGGLTSIKVSESGVETLYCENEECPGKLAQRIDHFCGKKGLDIKGISRKTIEKLIDWGWVNELTDIYKLNGYRAVWISKTGFGEASVNKILLSIDASRSGASLENFIAALGIPLIGRTIAKEITKYYFTWEDFRAAVGGDWTEFDGFGPEISKAINNFDYTEADEIAKLFTWKSTEFAENQISSAIKDKTFCITGKLTSGEFKNRDALKADIESRGGKVVGSMSSKVNYLINNDNTSTTAKNKAAQAAGIPIITEAEYLKMRIDA